jgi:hypothetical protein
MAVRYCQRVQHVGTAHTARHHACGTMCHILRSVVTAPFQAAVLLYPRQLVAVTSNIMLMSCSVLQVHSAPTA